MHALNKHFLPPIMRQEPGAGGGGTEVSMLHHLTTRRSGSVSISAPVGPGVAQDTWVSGLPDERLSPSRHPHLISLPFPHHHPSSQVRLHSLLHPEALFSPSLLPRGLCLRTPARPLTLRFDVLSLSHGAPLPTSIKLRSPTSPSAPFAGVLTTPCGKFCFPICTPFYPLDSLLRGGRD